MLDDNNIILINMAMLQIEGCSSVNIEEGEMGFSLSFVRSRDSIRIS